ncbi:MAG TPA: PAS domain-containing protein [Chitinophagaceae bacterium]|nr:PAS domain-containing protein [Chitinophagaceae bacterium]
MIIGWKDIRATLVATGHHGADFLTLLDEEGTMLFANARMMRELKLENPKQRKQSFYDLLDPGFATVFRDAVRYSLSKEEPRSFDLCMKNGWHRPMNWQVRFLPQISNGKNIFLCGGVLPPDRDSLEAMQERLDHLSRITYDAIWEWDMLSGEIFRNEKLMKMIGYQKEEPRGLNWWLSRVHSQDREPLIETLKQVTDESLPSWKSRYRFRCANGEYKHMLDRGFVVYRNGLPVKMIGSLTDITREKLMEEELMLERTRRWQEASELAVRVQEQERVRLGSELHDNVNQILSTVKLYAGMLRPSSEPVREIRGKLIEYTSLAIEEIRKLTREMVAPQLQAGSLEENISRICEDLRRSTNVRVNFVCEVCDGLLRPAQKLNFFRIVQEQVRNIIKYSRADEVVIELVHRRDRLELSIGDNGIGFDSKTLITGIGFSSIIQRARYLNGFAEIESAPGNGCRVFVSVPAS